MAGMSFPLGSLLRGGAATEGAGAAPPATSPHWRERLWLVLGGVAWLIVLIALATHDPADAAFSTSGADVAVHNKAGRLGAWISDMAFFLFGFSAWWWMPVTARTWLSALARHLRGDMAQYTPFAVK